MSITLRMHHRPSLPVVLQDERTECGLACLVMVGCYFGHQIDLAGLRKRFTASTLGSNLRLLQDIAMQMGLRARALQVPIQDLALMTGPAVLHWNMNHFVVLKKVRRNSIIIHDPAFGVRKVPLEEVSRAFTGIVLAFEKSDDFQILRLRQKVSLFALVKQIRGLSRFLMTLLCVALCIEVLGLVNPLFMQYVTDNVIATTEINNLVTITLAFLLLMCLQASMTIVRDNMAIYLSHHLTEQFSTHIVQHLLRLPLAFFEKRHKGDLQSKFQSIAHIQQKLSVDFLSAVLDGVFMVLNFVVMLLYSPLLSLMVFGALTIFVVVRFCSYHLLKNQTEASLYQQGKAATSFLEMLQGMMPIKLFLKEQDRMQVWRNANVQALNAEIMLSKMQVIYKMVSMLLFQGEYIVVVCMGSFLVLRHQFSVGMLMAFLSYRTLLVHKSSSLIQTVFDYQLIKVQLNRLNDIMCADPEPMSHGFGNVSDIQGAIRLHKVSFCYEGAGSPTFRHLSLTIAAGEKVAIVGPSGCGKTTLLKVMMGLLVKTEGQICIDNTPLEILGLQSYRQIIAAVMQDDVLFSGSILDNIAFFESHVVRERVYEVAALACIHDTIQRLPMGYETLVGDMGSILSGGQKQRILLARALYRQPKILFLDEATSHLDAAHEHSINQALCALSVTQVIIAHRKETIAMADRVVDLSRM